MIYELQAHIINHNQLEDFPSDVLDESEFRIDQVLKHEKEKLRYTYDFDDHCDILETSNDSYSI